MKHKNLIPAALAITALAGSAVQAQTTTGTSGTTNRGIVGGTGFNTGFNNGFNTGFNNGFNNGFTGLNNGFNNGFGTGFNNGFGNGFNTGVNPGFNAFGNGFNGFNNGFNGFNNGATFGNPGLGGAFGLPSSGLVDPRLNANGSSLGYTPGVTPGNQFVPGNGYGGGYYGPYGGYSGSTVDSTGAFAQSQGMGGGGMGMRGGLRIAGVNAPPVGRSPYRRIRVRDSGSGSGYDYLSRQRADEISRQTGNPATVPTAGSNDDTFASTDPRFARNPTGNQTGSNGTDATINGQVNVGSTDPQQVRLAEKMENVMENRPLTEGMIMRKDSNGLMVRYEQNGELKVERFPLDNVFYFQNGGKLQTASTGLNSLQPGDRVLVPMPAASPVIRQSVAGSRQETSSRSTVRSRAAAKARARRSAK